MRMKPAIKLIDAGVLVEGVEGLRVNLEVIDLAHASYQDAYLLQKQYVEEKVSHPDTCPDRLLVVEHDAVYTLGRFATEDNLLYDEKERLREGIGLVSTDRGGEVTYHGPGQITVYPIIRLSVKQRRGVAWYVDGLEEVIIMTLREFSLEGARDSINPGVWVGADKIAAIGVRVTRQVTMHGFALNVCAHLDHYRGIIPCGIQGRGVTSMHLHCANVNLKDVKASILKHFAEVFSYSNISYRKAPYEKSESE
jgi:lipoate-protein ligase B